MKKHIFRKVLAALFVLAASCYTFNLQAQDIVLEFTNPDGLDYGSSNDGFDGTGLGGDTDPAVDDPWVEFKFSIGPAGDVDLDVSTATAYQPVVDVLNTWDKTGIAKITNNALFGKTFSLILTAESRMQLGKDVDGNRGGIGVRGKNQRRIDDEKGNTEWMQFELTGDVGIDFVRFGYNDVSGGDNAHAIIKDHDTDQYLPLIDGVDGNPHPESLYLDISDYNMRYRSDILFCTKADTMADGGYRIYSLEFNIVEAEPKPPAITSVVPPRGDSLSFVIADAIELQFDTQMDQATTAAAVSISPAVTNRVDTWTAEDDGDLLTISYDDLTYETWYTIVVSTAAKATNGLTMLEADTIMFKTLPKPPEVVATFPENLEVDVWPNSPISIEFTKEMISDSVEKGIIFDPVVENLTYVWSDDGKTVYISGNELDVSTMYFVTIGEPAMDIFLGDLESTTFVFTTAITTKVENDMASQVTIYPNPASDMLRVKGMDVGSLKIHNLSGQLVTEIHNSNVISVLDIETGIYVVSVSDREGNKTRKMVVIE